MKKTSIRQHLMTGVSHMIPFVVAGGVILALSVLFSGSAAVPSDPVLLNFFNIGAAGLGLMVPVLAGYIAYSMADRPGLAPGFIGGALANTVGAGFLGGIVAGILAGYVANQLKKIPLPKSLETIRPIIVIPLFGTLVVGIVMVFIIGSPIANFMVALTEGLKGLGTANRYVLGAVVGAMMAFDMGGPVNKVAYGLGVALVATIDPNTGMPIKEGLEFMAAVGASNCTPPIGMGLASFLAPKKFSAEERDAGKAAVVMGAIGITEGAIPFAANDPIRIIPSLCVGSAIAGITTMALGVGNPAPWGGWIVLPVVTNKFGFFIATALGSVVTAAMSIALKKDYVEEVSEVATVSVASDVKLTKTGALNIVAVTACPSGVAHTYMAAKALQKAAEAAGHTIKVETQGSIGIENVVTDEDVANADIVILTSDIGIKNEERFHSKPVHRVLVKEAVKNAKSIIEEISNK